MTPGNYYIRVSSQECTDSTWWYTVRDSSNSKVIYADAADPVPSVGVFKVSVDSYRTIKLHSNTEPACTFDHLSDFKCVNYPVADWWEAIPVTCDCEEDANAAENCYVLRNVEFGEFVKFDQPPTKRLNGKGTNRIEDAAKILFELITS